MRIHGNKIINRREYQIEKHYTEAKEILKEDFSGLCGYCGKNSNYLLYNYEIDHFVPRKIAPERENDYQNLVFACRKCNRAKSHKWPTGNKNIANNGKEGFVDPATSEYDKHLERDQDGRIIYKTELGKYIYNELHFDIRRTDFFWMIEMLFYIQERFEEIEEKGRLSSEEKSFYIDLNKQLKMIQFHLAAQGE